MRRSCFTEPVQKTWRPFVKWTLIHKYIKITGPLCLAKARTLPSMPQPATATRRKILICFSICFWPKYSLVLIPRPTVPVIKDRHLRILQLSSPVFTTRVWTTFQTQPCSSCLIEIISTQSTSFNILHLSADTYSGKRDQHTTLHLPLLHKVVFQPQLCPMQSLLVQPWLNAQITLAQRPCQVTLLHRVAIQPQL